MLPFCRFQVPTTTILVRVHVHMQEAIFACKPLSYVQEPTPYGCALSLVSKELGHKGRHFDYTTTNGNISRMKYRSISNWHKVKPCDTGPTQHRNQGRRVAISRKCQLAQASEHMKVGVGTIYLHCHLDPFSILLVPWNPCLRKLHRFQN